MDQERGFACGPSFPLAKKKDETEQDSQQKHMHRIKKVEKIFPLFKVPPAITTVHHPKRKH